MSEIICQCMDVSKEEIIEAVKKGCDTVEKVADETGATTGCGGCEDEVQAIIDEHKA